MYKFLSGLVLFFSMSLALATEGIRECPGLPAPTKVDIEGCDKAPCVLIRGKNAEVITEFTSNEYAEQLKTRSFFTEIQSGIAGEFPLPNDKSNTCNWLLNSKCPVYPTEDIRFELSMPVLIIYPKNMELDLKITVENEENVIVSCFQVAARTSG